MMKKVIIVLLTLVVLLFSFHAQAEDLITAIHEAYGAETSYAEINGKLIIMGDFEALTNPANNQNKPMQDYQEELRKYSDIIMLMYKNDMLYLAVTMPLTDGKITENTATPLMSPAYIQENIQIGSK